MPCGRMPGLLQPRSGRLEASRLAASALTYFRFRSPGNFPKTHPTAIPRLASQFSIFLMLQPLSMKIWMSSATVFLW
jgi:hypothetical protein